ncbi:MAG TPA: DNA-binding protein [Spirochaetia bacterium]|nr:DNA-binding protein [Spirochaetia bacterium]
MSECKNILDIGKNLLAVRKELGLNLDELSKRSGVSKSMLSQIEQNNANPTVLTVWKISRAINVPMQKIIDPGKNGNFEIIKKDMAAIIKSPDRNCEIKVLTPAHYIDKVELYSLKFKKGGVLKSQGHFCGTEEIVTVISGMLEIKSGGQTEKTGRGDTIRYAADTEHIIKNITGQIAQAVMLVIYKF